MLTLIFNLWILNFLVHAKPSICANVFFKEDVHLSKSEERITFLSEKYNTWSEVKLNQVEFLSALQGLKVGIITLKSSELFQHYSINQIESVVDRIDYSHETNFLTLKLKNGMSVPWAQMQRLYIDPSKISTSVFKDSEKLFKLRHFSKLIKSNCHGCLELGNYSRWNGYQLRSKLEEYHSRLTVVFYESKQKKIRTLKYVKISSRDSIYSIKEVRTGRSWNVPAQELGFIGVLSPHSH